MAGAFTPESGFLDAVEGPVRSAPGGMIAEAHSVFQTVRTAFVAINVLRI